MWRWVRATHRTPHWVRQTHRTPHWGARQGLRAATDRWTWALLGRRVRGAEFGDHVVRLGPEPDRQSLQEGDPGRRVASVPVESARVVVPLAVPPARVDLPGECDVIAPGVRLGDELPLLVENWDVPLRRRQPREFPDFPRVGFCDRLRATEDGLQSTARDRRASLAAEPEFPVELLGGAALALDRFRQDRLYGIEVPDPARRVECRTIGRCDRDAVSWARNGQPRRSFDQDEAGAGDLPFVRHEYVHVVGLRAVPEPVSSERPKPGEHGGSATPDECRSQPLLAGGLGGM